LVSIEYTKHISRAGEGRRSEASEADLRPKEPKSRRGF
jgi:hypothetical protein